MIRALCLALLCAGQAQALSCMAPDVVRSYQRADADSARWGAVIGRLDFDETRLPRTDWEQQDQTPQVTELPAQLIGHSLGKDGWNHIFQQNVTLQALCYGPWCAAPQSARSYLAFVKRDAGRRLVIADPCGQWLFAAPSQKQRDQLHQCFAGGHCEAVTP